MLFFSFLFNEGHRYSFDPRTGTNSWRKIFWKTNRHKPGVCIEMEMFSAIRTSF